jgi:hypothetical protein
MVMEGMVTIQLAVSGEARVLTAKVVKRRKVVL